MAAGPGPWLLALALALWPAGLWAQLRLQEAGGGLRVAGDSVTLSCRGSGFTFKQYHIRWYRQTTEGRLEWISFISFSMGRTKDYGAAVKGRAEASRDNSRSEAYLSLRSLQAEDSARYFCAVTRGQEMQMSFNTIQLSLAQRPLYFEMVHFKVMRSKQQALQCGGQQGTLGPSIAFTAPKPLLFTWPGIGSILGSPCSTCCSARPVEAPTATQPLLPTAGFPAG